MPGAQFSPEGRSDTSLEGHGSSDGKNAADATAGANKAAGDGYDPGFNYLEVVKRGEAVNAQFVGAMQRAAWMNTHRAFRNQHIENSKYTSKPFRNRSKLFRPKTRTAVRRSMANTAAAFFANADVVSISAQRDSDPVQLASAAILQEVLNYRLDRTSGTAGMPWFLVVIGACLDGNLQGIIVSKQYWDFRVVKEMVPVEDHAQTFEPQVDPTHGGPVFDETGAQVMESVTTITEREEEQEFVTRNRPYCSLVPGENVIIDPAAPWENAAQESGYFTIKHPMSVEEAMTMMASKSKNSARGNVEWLDINESDLDAIAEDFPSKGVRVERSGGVDRMSEQAGTGGTSGEAGRNKVVWLYENFVRQGGVDYHFWSLKAQTYASTVKPTRQVYPEQRGERPYVYGFAAIESHNIAPQGAVEGALPLQQEINEVVNLRLDAAKQALSPIAKVVQGSVFDWSQLQHRGGADTTIIVRKPEDLTFERPPGATMDAFQEMNNLNADFDSLTGTFDGGSVNTNRQLNETVGGMRMLSNSANALGEFDLRVFSETWAEPTVRQITRLIQYYEDDETILAVAGERAKLEKFGVSEITDRDLEAEVTVRVNVGIGAADPFQRIQKLAMAFGIIGQAAPFFDKKPKLKAEQVIKEVMGGAGYNDGMRFFDFEGDNAQPPPEMMLEMMKLNLEQAKLDVEQQMNGADNQTRIEVANIQGRLALIGQLISEMAQNQRHTAEQEHGKYLQFAGSMSDFAREGMRHSAAAHAAHHAPKPTKSAA